MLMRTPLPLRQQLHRQHLRPPHSNEGGAKGYQGSCVACSLVNSGFGTYRSGRERGGQVIPRLSEPLDNFEDEPRNRVNMLLARG